MLRVLGVLFLLGLLVLPSCGVVDPPETRVVFKFNVDSKLIPVSSDSKYWVIVRKSDDGALIDYKAVVTGGAITFESDEQIPDGKIDVAYLWEYTYVTDASTNISYEAKIYTRVDVGSEMTMNLFDQPTKTNQSAGTYSLLVAGVPTFTHLEESNVYAFSISDNHGLRDGWAYGGIGYVSSDHMDIRSGSTTQMISIDPGNGNPKYLLMENLKDKDHISKSYSDFKSFDKLVTVNFPSAVKPLVFASGFEQPIPRYTYYGGAALDGFVVYSNFLFGSDVPRSSLTLGFINSIPNYVISLSAGNFAYLSVGPAPAAIDYVDPSSFKITDRNLETFSFTASKNFQYHMPQFQYIDAFDKKERKSVVFKYFAGTGPTKFHQPIPDELIKQFSIPADKVSFVLSSFFVKGRTYDDLLKGDKTFDGTTNEPPAPFEMASVYVQ